MGKMAKAPVRTHEQFARRCAANRREWFRLLVRFRAGLGGQQKGVRVFIERPTVAWLDRMLVGLGDWHQGKSRDRLFRSVTRLGWSKDQ